MHCSQLHIASKSFISNANLLREFVRPVPVEWIMYKGPKAHHLAATVQQASHRFTAERSKTNHTQLKVRARLCWRRCQCRAAAAVRLPLVRAVYKVTLARA